MQPKTQVIILAAGYGKRMHSEMPKALIDLHGVPFVSHVLKAVKESGVCERPIVVVGQKREHVMAVLGDAYTYAIQEEQLGTGHAVMCAKESAKDAERIIILYADQPLVSAKMIAELEVAHTLENATITMATSRVPDFNEWRDGFSNFSRIIRNEKGDLVRVVEPKDATEEELKIMEVNPCYFCFDAKWMWDRLEKIKNNNAQGEYYLTDLVGMAFNEGKHIATIPIHPKEALGANTKEQAEMLALISAS
jgi:bifunctional UDP-N-acetylglucosamine pyrophosphorylase/glucosamine-1-phosphate N-acetyltransferase